MKKLILYLFTMHVLGLCLVNAQTITGVVTGADDGQPLPGVNIKVKDSNAATVTDLNGNYSISGVTEQSVLVFSFVGYVPQEILAGTQTTIDVSLALSYEALDEVIVVGYGVKKKSLVTGSISSVGEDELANTSSTRADQAIMGKVSGVQVKSISGSPGTGTKIRIRGTSSTGKSDPLYIVDGMKTSDINNIDPSEIESIEVLKDAASSAIYGTEGGNGVILITTKTGKSDKGEIVYDFQYGSQSLRTNMELMDSKQYTDWMTEAGISVRDSFNANTDWMNEVFQTAPMQKHFLSFSGGNEKTTYMASGSYLTQDGIVGGDKANYERYIMRLNVTSDVKKWLEIGESFSYSHSRQKYVGEDDEYRGIVNNTLLVDPLTPILYPTDSTAAGYDYGQSQIQAGLDDGHALVKDGNGNYYALTQNVDGEIVNPLALLSTYHNNITIDKLLGTAYVTLKPLKGLSLTSRMGLDLSYRTRHFWTPEYFFSTEQSNGLASVDDTITKSYAWIWDNFATYNKSFNKHDVTLMVGYSAQEIQSPNYGLHGAGMVSEDDYFAYYDFLPEANDNVGGNMITKTQASFFGRLSYAYANKYLLEGSLRRDGASEFPADNKYAFFPSVSAGWVISNEGFFDAVKFIDYAKARVSWGSNGSKANLPGNEDIQQVTTRNTNYIDAEGNVITGSTIVQLTNPDLVWEKSKMLDAGLDLRFLKNKLFFTADYYNKKTEDLITRGTPPPSAGNNAPYVNAGTVVNYGLDFELGYSNNDHAFKYGITANLSFLHNNVTDLGTSYPIHAVRGLRGYDLCWFEEGKPIWYFKGFETDGIFDDQTEADAYNLTYGTSFVAGDPIVVDVSKNGTIGPEDMTEIGSPHPDMLYGGNIFLGFKGLDFNLTLQGSQGNDVFMGWYRTDRPQTNKPAYFYEDRWTVDNPGAEFPRADNTSNYLYRSDLMVANGSYLRFRTIQLGYTIPGNILSKVGLNSLRVYVSLDDYFTITNYPGLDPEVGSTTNDSQGVDRGLYPQAGKVLFGLSVKL